MLQLTSEQHGDYKDLKQALKEINEIATTVNLNMQKEENLKKLYHLDHVIVGLPKSLTDESNSLLFIREGVLTKVCRKSDKKRHFFLFNDCLIYTALASPQGEFKFKRLLSLSKSKIRDLTDTAERKNAFQIITIEKSFTVYTEASEKAAWMRGFHSILSYKIDRGMKANLCNH